MGWIVLQCAIQKVNTLFAWEESLGQTGETFLINQHGFMLTESNFDGDSTLLKKRLDDRNIQAKFSEKKGHRMVTDYRGHAAVTSFEVVHFLGTRWLVVAKVDRDEIITRHYALHRRYYADSLLDYLEKAPAPALREFDAAPYRAGLRVDMDECLKASHGERLHWTSSLKKEYTNANRKCHRAGLYRRSRTDQLTSHEDPRRREMKKQTTLGKRIAMGFTLVILIAVAIGGLGVWSMLTAKADSQGLRPPLRNPNRPLLFPLYRHMSQEMNP